MSNSLDRLPVVDLDISVGIVHKGAGEHHFSSFQYFLRAWGGAPYILYIEKRDERSSYM